MSMIISAALSNIGRVRENNEDNYFINGVTLSLEMAEPGAVADETEGAGLYAVCDGLGGGEHGELASAIAVDTLRETFSRMKDQDVAVDKVIDWFTHTANDRICAEMERLNSWSMGTTFVVLGIRDDTVRIYNLGDSRAYLLWKSNIKQLTRDHTKAKELVDMGLLTEEQAKTHPERNQLTQHLGIYSEDMEVEPYKVPAFKLMAGDKLLLCSDGLTDMLGDQEILDIMSVDSSPSEIAEALVGVALQRGGKDNITVIVALPSANV